MSKQASPTLIGVFVLGAIAILVMFVLLIAGDSFNRQSERYVVFFDESVNGLTVGSNVMFRGVPIGVVHDIDVVVNASTAEFFVPVYIDIFEGSVGTVPGSDENPMEELESDDEDTFEFLLDQGLRAALKTESLITGRLFINLDFFPNEPLVLRGFTDEYPEIPSITTGIEAFIENTRTVISDLTEALDVEQFGKDLSGIASGLNEILNDAETQRMPSEINATLVDLQTTLENANSLLSSAEGDTGSLAESLGTTLQELETLLRSINLRLSESSDTTYRINATLAEIEGAARSIRILSEYLEANPEALIQGKPAE